MPLDPQSSVTVEGAGPEYNNMQPIQTARFDDVLIAGKRKDAGFILHGGFQ